MASSTSIKKFITLLIAAHRITSDQAQAVQSVKSLAEVIRILEKEFAIDGEVIARGLAELFHFPYVDLVGRTVPVSILNVIPREMAQNYQLIAYNLSGKNLDIALTDPIDLKAQEAVALLVRERGWTVTYAVTSRAGFQAAEKAYSGLRTEVKEALDVAEGKFTETKDKKQIKEENIEEVIHSAPVSKMMQVIVKHAVDARASDIHIEPLPEETRVRYRIDGVLYTSLVVPKYLNAALVSRVKVLSNLKIDETRIPQDGRMRFLFGDHYINFRVSTFPLYNNEKVVIRILDTTERVITMEGLGFWGKNLTIMQEGIERPHGLFLVTGPTGSGKSTTLFAGLNKLNNEGVNIVTLEDPVEYFVKGVNQAQINSDIGFTFATGLRSILRQDPDVIMVGEIRDNETAELAIHAALTGHLVLSTLHTNDAFGAIPRLIDMKTPSFLLASTINVIIAQRLVRTICEHCKEEEKPHVEVEAELKRALATIPPSALPSDLAKQKTITLYHGKGCPRCDLTGYAGRTVISEVLPITESLRSIILSGANPDAVKKEFVSQGMFSLMQDGLIKVLRGQTTLEQVLSTTKP